ncbi:hypothetical protein ACFL54_00150 [Planctomycetota bacterium]
MEFVNQTQADIKLYDALQDDAAKCFTILFSGGKLNNIDLVRTAIYKVTANSFFDIKAGATSKLKVYTGMYSNKKHPGVPIRDQTCIFQFAEAKDYTITVEYIPTPPRDKTFPAGCFNKAFILQHKVVVHGSNMLFYIGGIIVLVLILVIYFLVYYFPSNKNSNPPQQAVTDNGSPKEPVNS